MEGTDYDWNASKGDDDTHCLLRTATIHSVIHLSFSSQITVNRCIYNENIIGTAVFELTFGNSSSCVFML